MEERGDLQRGTTHFTRNRWVDALGELIHVALIVGYRPLIDYHPCVSRHITIRSSYAAQILECSDEAKLGLCGYTTKGMATAARYLTPRKCER